jgi:hypothetical protein
MGIKNWYTVAKDKEGMKESVLIAKVHNRLYSLRRTKRRRKTRTQKLHTTATCNC